MREQQSVVLVTGGTGNVGRQVVSQLLGTGVAVRALTRDPGSAGLPGGVEVVRGDLADPDTLDACLDGVDAVFLVWPFLTAEAAPAVLEVAAKHARRVAPDPGRAAGTPRPQRRSPRLTRPR